MAILSKSKLLAAGKLPTVDVPCPELATPEDPAPVVRLRMLTAAERDQFESHVAGEDGKVKPTNIRATLVAYCIVGEDGADCDFTPAEIEALGRQRGDVIDRLFDAARSLNKMRREDAAREKNGSAGEASAGSSFASPSPLGVPVPTNLPPS